MLNFGTRSLAVLGVLIIAAGILITTYSRDIDDINTDFDRACHTPGEVPQECDEVFTKIPFCAYEDCADQWPNPGFFIGTDGRMFFQLPASPTAR